MTVLERNCRKIEEWGERLAEARLKGWAQPELVLESLQSSQTSLDRGLEALSEI